MPGHALVALGFEAEKEHSPAFHNFFHRRARHVAGYFLAGFGYYFPPGK
jgi:hypothetical protein